MMGGEDLTGFEAAVSGLRSLFALCLLAAGLDALLGRSANAMRLVCGLCVALCVAKTAAELIR